MQDVTLYERLHGLDELDLKELRRLHNADPARLERQAGSLHAIYTGLINIFWRVELTTFLSGKLVLQHALVEDPNDSDLKPVELKLNERGGITAVAFV